MNEQLEKFAKQAKLLKSTTFPNLRLVDDDELEHFAQLVRQDERESCAVLVEGNNLHPNAPDVIWAKTVAKLIRARGNYEQD
jgi:hypothetical protein